MGNKKLDLIKQASNSAPLKRVEEVHKPIRENQSFYIGDTMDIVKQFKKGALSKAIQKSLKLAYDKGELKEFIEDK